MRNSPRPLPPGCQGGGRTRGISRDDFKPLPNVTLNLGLRWSYESPYNTKYGGQSQFDPDAIDPISGQRDAILHPKGPLSSRDLNNFQPRVGLAWQIKPSL